MQLSISNLTRIAAVAVGLWTISAGAASCDDVATAGTTPLVTPSGGVVLDDSQPGWIWTGMVEYQDPGLHGGTAHAGGPGRSCAYTFSGTGVEVFGMKGPTVTVDGRAHRMGSVNVFIDGKLKGTSSERASDSVYDCTVARITGLSDGNHVLQVEPEGGWMVIDYIAVMHASSEDTAASGSAQVLGGEAVLKRTSSSAQSNGSGVKSVATTTETKSSQGSRQTAPVQYKGLLKEGSYLVSPKSATSMFLSPAGGSTDNGTGLVIQSEQTVWRVTPVGDDQYRVSPLSAPDSALTIVARNSNQDRTPAVIWHYSGDPAQKLVIKSLGASGFVNITPGTFANGTTAGAPVSGSNFRAGANQLWKFVAMR